MFSRRFALSIFTAVCASVVLSSSLRAEDAASALKNVKRWAYQLKDVSQDKIDKIIASPYDMIIIDASMFPNGKEIPLTREQVESMKKKPDGGRRIILSYFSAGEAEDFRYYWRPEWNKKWPAWVSRADKDWKGDYIVKYWDPEWRKIIYGSAQSLIDRILEAGFDGVSIDRVDSYYYFGDTKERRLQMVDLIKDVSGYIRSKKPDAVIIAQNAEELLDKPDYIDAIDATVKEDLVFGISHREIANSQESVAYSTKLLELLKQKGKHVFVVEYLSKRDNIRRVRDFMKDHDFVLYVGQRDLYELSGVVEE